MPPTDNTIETLPAVQQAIPNFIAGVREIRALKPGYKTTEFWLTIVFNVANAAVLIVPATSQAAKVAGFIVASLTILGYSVSRGRAKSSQ